MFLVASSSLKAYQRALAYHAGIVLAGYFVRHLECEFDAGADFQRAGRPEEQARAADVFRHALHPLFVSRDAIQNRHLVAETAFARCPCLSGSTFSRRISARARLVLWVFQQGYPAHLRPVIAVLRAAVNAHLVILAGFVAARPRELMAAGREESVKELSVHAGIIACFRRLCTLPK